MKTWCRKHDLGRWILRSRSISFEDKPNRFSIVLFVLLLSVVKLLKEYLNTMLLQESEKEAET